MGRVTVSLGLALVLLVATPSACDRAGNDSPRHTGGSAAHGDSGGAAGTSTLTTGGSSSHAGASAAGGHTPSDAGRAATTAGATNVAGGGTPSGGASSGGTSGSDVRGGAAGAAGEGGEGAAPCGSTPKISNAEAAELVKALAFEDPDFNRDTVFDALELEIPALWDTLRVQIFDGYYDFNGDSNPSATFVYHDGTLEPLPSAQWYGLDSALVRADALYYSFTSGSGIVRSTLARLRRTDCTLQTLLSGGYVSEAASPTRRLFLTSDGDRILVNAGTYTSLNTYSDEAPFGQLAETETSLAILDAQGQVIPPNFPRSP